ncbi:MAG: hypothetical protein V3572_17025, partial [Desulfolutivibrio sp.]
LIGAAAGGGDALWRGALIGGGIGAVTGAATSMPEARYQLRRGIQTELETLALRPVPASPYGLTAGYVYFPANAGIGWVRITVRTQSATYSYDVSIAAPASDLAPRPTSATPAYQHAPAGQANPAVQTQAPPPVLPSARAPSSLSPYQPDLGAPPSPAP